MRYLALASVLCMVGAGLLQRPAPPSDDPGSLVEDGWNMETGPNPREGRVPVRAAPSASSRNRIEGGTFTDVKTATYAVEGSTDMEILASLQAKGPRTEGEGFFGMTVSEPSFQVQPVSDGSSCVADDVRIDLTVTITLPTWTPPSDVDGSLEPDWTAFSAALKRHEDGHREIAERAAKATHQALVGIRRPTCEAVEFEARQRAQQVAADAEAEHHRYDEQTDHGRTQGAQWPRS